jgi:hypothetical protein
MNSSTPHYLGLMPYRTKLRRLHDRSHWRDHPMAAILPFAFIEEESFEPSSGRSIPGHFFDWERQEDIRAEIAERT